MNGFSWNRITYVILYCDKEGIDINILSEDFTKYKTECLKKYNDLIELLDLNKEKLTNYDLTKIASLISPWDFMNINFELINEVDEKARELNIEYIAAP